MDYFSPHSNVETVDIERIWEDHIKRFAKDNPYLVDIENLGLSVRAYNCLKRAGVQTMGDVCELGPEGLEKVRNLGSKCMREIITVLKTYDIVL